MYGVCSSKGTNSRSHNVNYFFGASQVLPNILIQGYDIDSSLHVFPQHVPPLYSPSSTSLLHFHDPAEIEVIISLDSPNHYVPNATHTSFVSSFLHHIQTRLRSRTISRQIY